MNSEKLTKRLEMGAYVAIIGMALVVTATLIPKLVGRYFPKSVTQAAPALKAGDRISVPNEDWEKNGKTLLLVLSTSCHFCTESAPFYRTLVAKTQNEQQLHVAAIFPQSVEEGREYLSSLGIIVADVLNVPRQSFEVKGTPTLILVDDKGAVVNSWTGKLAPTEESAVISKVTSETN
jgi:thioredoxin-related protein